MKSRILRIVKQLFITLGCPLFLSAAIYAEPPNLSILKKEVQVYHDTGLYEKELASVVSQAQCYILQQVAVNQQTGNRKKLAIVLDIDETSLSNYRKIVKRDFVLDRAQIHKAILAADAPAIAPTLSLYRSALKHGVQVFFVTGRPLSELHATKANLKRVGYKHWAGLYLRPNNYNRPSIIPFKTKTREAITKQGYTIIASIGDQYSDLKGGFTLKGFKLPNPFYFLP
jgi:predicted secreted acid phosphatase